VSIAFVLLALLIGATPVFLFWETPTATGVVAALLAVALAIVARAILPGERIYVLDRIRPIAIVAAVPCVWIMIQLLPLGSLGLSHQIWSSAAAALGRPTWGSISIDVGATAVALCRYLCAVGVVVLAATLAANRRRAEGMFLILVAATAAIAVTTLFDHFAKFGLPEGWDGTAARTRAMQCAALGVVLAAGWAIRTLERRKTRRTRLSVSAFNFALAAAAFVCCLLPLARGSAGMFLMAAGYGLATLIAFEIGHRFGLGGWAWAGMIAAAFVGGVAIVTRHPPPAVEVTLAFAADAAPVVTAAAQRMLNDVPWAGTGAGTFAQLLPMYRDAGEMLEATWPPTAAAGVAIELGRWMLAALVVTAVAAAAILLRAGLLRGRDSVYCAAGAGCIVATLILGFGSAGVFATANSIVLAVVLGLAVAQSKSRSVR
jgi:hypothetical protein